MKSGITSNMDSINIENLISKTETINIEYENRIEGVTLFASLKIIMSRCRGVFPVQFHILDG